MSGDQAALPYRSTTRSARGMVLPLVAFAVMLIMATLAFTADLGRDLLASGQLFHAARAAALYGMAFAYAPVYDGSPDLNTVQSNISGEIASPAVSSLNRSIAGPSGAAQGGWAPVSFGSDSVSLSPNPDDSTEAVLRVTASLTGASALKTFFLPAVYAFSGQSGSGAPGMSPARWCEVIGQPAARVGPGVPTGTAGAGPFNYSAFAALPLAISALEFPAISYPVPPGTSTSFTVQLVSSASPGQQGAMKGCLVNVAESGGSSPYYGSAQGHAAIDHLEQLLGYVGAQTNLEPVAPAAVERNSMLAAFDPADPTFASRAGEVAGALNSLVSSPQQQPYFVVPVLAADPSFQNPNQVIGFAYLALKAVQVNSAGVPLSLTVSLGPSIPLPNTAATNEPSGIPASGLAGGGAVSIPQQFSARQVDGSTGGITPRYLGVALAPAPSPRLIGLKP